MTPRRLLIAFGLIVFALLTSAVVSWQAASQVIQNEQRVVHTQQIISELRGLTTAMAGAEAAKFIYGYTRKADDLTPFYSAKDSLASHLSRIAFLTQDNPEQLQRARFLKEAAQAKYNRIDSVLAISRIRGTRAAQPFMADRRGQTLLDRVRLIADEMARAEEALLVVRSAASQESVNRLMGTIALTTLLGLVMVGFLYRLAERDLALQRIEQEGMAASNERLTAAVNERTREIQDANVGLQRLTEELQRSNRELQDFAYVASHDLQEPLRKIRAFSDLLVTDYGPQFDDEGRHYLNRVDDAAARMSRLITDLLTYSRVSSKARPPEPVALNDVLVNVLDDLDVALREATADVDVSSAMPVVEADPVQMHQLFQNLVGNAVKFRKPGEAAHVWVWAETALHPQSGIEMARIYVRDSGIGFDNKYAERIFSPFERLHAKQQYAGTGIGLAVCRRIVERHGGTIRATSAPNEGTTFTVMLPLAAAPSPIPFTADDPT